MPCKSVSELIGLYGVDWQNSVTINGGPYSSLSDCDQGCGICCVASCSWPTSFNTQYFFGSCGAPGDSHPIEGRITLTVSQTNPNYFGAITSIPWKPGYPAALPPDWRWIESTESRNIGSEFPPSFCCDTLGDVRPDCVNAPTPNDRSGRQYYSEITFKKRLFGCIGGVMTDITEEALFIDQYVIPSGAYTANNIPFNWLDNKIIYTRNQIPEYTTPNTFSITAYKVNEGFFENQGAFFIFSAWPFVVQDRPPLPNEVGAAGIVYVCDDTKTKSQCENIGIWRAGKTCESFDCNAP